MIDKTASDFVRENFVEVHDLASLYTEYRKEISEAYWQELCGL
jgi:hypothetical protein